MFFNEEYTLVNKLETHTAAGIELWPCSKNLSRNVLTFIMKFTSLVYRLFEQVFKRWLVLTAGDSYTAGAS